MTDDSEGRAKALLVKAREAAANAYAPYSCFAVGAAVLTTDGKIFAGANMENASYGLTVCAEVGALQAASLAGQLHKIVHIAIVGGAIHPNEDYQPKATAPCGRCRQLISEAAMLGNRDIEVSFADLNGGHMERKTISQLLPDAFGPKDVK